MPYCFEDNEKLPDAFFRVLDEEVKIVQQHLSGIRQQQPGAIHEYRRHLKKARSLVRLGRYCLSKKVRRTLAQELAQATRVFAPFRDVEARLECLDAIIRDSQEMEYKNILLRFRENVKGDGEKESQNLPDLLTAADTAAQYLECVLGQRQSIMEGRFSWPLILKGMARAYQDTRDMMNQAWCADVEKGVLLHEWRKHAKHVRHHALLVSSIWPAYFKMLESELHKVTDLLGHIHDMALLIECMGMLTESTIPTDEKAVIIPLLEERARYKAEEAFARGRILFVEPPRKFYRRLTTYAKVVQKPREITEDDTKSQEVTKQEFN